MTNALAAALMLAELLLQAAGAAARFQELLGKAKAEGRDLTAGELSELVARRDDTIAAWKAAR